jgi:dTDP-glucose pyrophosphorylase
MDGCAARVPARESGDERVNLLIESHQMSRDVSRPSHKATAWQAAPLDMTTRIDKAVVLAAGRGTRMRELTADLPKPMIAVRSKPVLQHIVEGLRDAGIRKFLIVVGYRGDTVRNFLGDGLRYNIAVQYTTQMVQDGTGRVVDLARDFVGDCPFVLSYGDILVDPANYKRVANLPDDVEGIITVIRGEDVSKGGAVFLNDRMELLDLREKSQPGEVQRWSGLSEHAVPFYNAGLYTFRPSIFEFTANLQPSPRGEYELTDAIRDLAHSGKKVKALELTGEWADVRDPEVLAKLNR